MVSSLVIFTSHETNSPKKGGSNGNHAPVKQAGETLSPAPKKAGFLFAMIRRKPSLHANSEDTDKARSAPRVGIPVRALSFPKQGFAGNGRRCGAFEFPQPNQPSFDLLEAPESPSRHAVAPCCDATRSAHDLCHVLGDPHPGFGREPRSDVQKFPGVRRRSLQPDVVKSCFRWHFH